MTDSSNPATPNPYPGEIWYIDSREIVLDHERLIYIPKRPCLILSSEEVIKDCICTVNIVPLSTKGVPDRYRFPVGHGIEHCIESFEKSEDSKALLHLYQSISRDHLNKKIARLELNTYLAVKEVLCNNVIGYTDV